MTTHIEAGCSVQKLDNVTDTRLTGHWELILQTLHHKHHNVLPRKGIAILQNLNHGESNNYYCNPLPHLHNTESTNLHHMQCNLSHMTATHAQQT